MNPISSLVSRSRLLIAAGTLVVGLVTAYAALQAYAGTAVPRHVAVGPVQIGGLAQAEAARALEAGFLHEGAAPFEVRVGELRFRMRAVNAAVHVDAVATVDRIMRDRRNPLTLIAMLRGAVQQPVLSVDDAELTEALSALAHRVVIPAVDAGIDMTAPAPTVIAARAGLELDVPSAARAIIARVADGERSIVLRRTERPAVVSTYVAQRVLEQVAMPAISEPVTVQLAMQDGSTRQSVITPETIRDALTFVPDGALLAPVLDGGVLRRDVDAALFDVQVFAKRAKFRIVDKAITVVPSIDGYGVTNASLAADVTKVLTQVDGARVVTLQLGAIPASFTTEDAQALGIRGLVSQYKQEFPPAAYRTQNIGTAARYINGTILLPGETFSMNDTVKERTVENGYTEGWIIGPDGVFRMEQGGAVSTITTAMFNAAWFAGLKLVEHRAHSIYISRYPAGREATVSWGSFDMKFKNDSDHAILITTKLRRSSISVYFWGTKQWQRIDSEFGQWTNQTPYREIVSTEPECHDQDGMPGFHITVWRTFWKDDVEVKREAYGTSYRPSPHVVCRSGAAPQPTVTPKPTPKPSKTTTPTPSPSATASPSDTAAA